jgi:CMP-N-acetylneuraminic acid synthetase
MMVKSKSAVKIVALVPMRHHSERVEGKNYRPVAGKPLYQHIVNSLLACRLISEVVIDTDSPRISEDVSENFPHIRLIDRPHHLRDGKVPMNEVLLHDVSQVDADYYLQTHSTNPLLRTATISRAIQLFLDNCSTYDSLFSATRLQVRLWDDQMRPVNHDPEILLRTQDLPPIYEENSCLYIFSKENLVKRGNRIGKRPLLFEINRLEAWDIDEELDLEIAEYLHLKYRKEK